MTTSTKRGPNSVYLEGTVKLEPIAREKVTNFLLMVPTGWKDNTTSIRCVVWHRDVEDCPEIVQGAFLRVEGRLGSRTYEKDGRKVEVTEVTCSSVELVKHKSTAPGARRPGGNPDGGPGEEPLPF